MNQLVSYFVRGCLAIVPVAVTLGILYWSVTAMDDLLGAELPGLGLAIAVVLVTLVGFALSNVLGRRLFNITDRWLARVPFVKLLYTSIRDLVSAFMGERRKFGRPVAVRPSVGSEMRLLGFLTRDDLRPLGMPHHVAVYFPQAYNFAGQLVVVPQELVEPLPVPSGELITFLVSGGASGFGLGTPSIPPPPPDSVPPPPPTERLEAPPPPGLGGTPPRDGSDV